MKDGEFKLPCEQARRVLQMLHFEIFVREPKTKTIKNVLDM